jgi:hypothetical protein
VKSQQKAHQPSHSRTMSAYFPIQSNYRNSHHDNRDGNKYLVKYRTDPQFENKHAGNYNVEYGNK